MLKFLVLLGAKPQVCLSLRKAQTKFIIFKPGKAGNSFPKQKKQHVLSQSPFLLVVENKYIRPLTHFIKNGIKLNARTQILIFSKAGFLQANAANKHKFNHYASLVIQELLHTAAT